MFSLLDEDDGTSNVREQHRVGKKITYQHNGPVDVSFPPLIVDENQIVYERKREQNRLRAQRFRENKKIVAAGQNARMPLKERTNIIHTGFINFSGLLLINMSWIILCFIFFLLFSSSCGC